MNSKYLIANAGLWASSIIASATLGAPTFLSLVILPALAVASLLLMTPKHDVAACFRR